MVDYVVLRGTIATPTVRLGAHLARAPRDARRLRQQTPAPWASMVKRISAGVCRAVDIGGGASIMGTLWRWDRSFRSASGVC